MRVVTTEGLRPASRGAEWITSDAGLPLRMFEPGETDPLKIWKTQPNVRKVIDFAARQVAALPWKVHRINPEGGRDRARDSAAEQLLRNPAPDAPVPGTRFRLVRDLVTEALIHDRYLAIVIDGRLEVIPAGRWKVTSDWLGRAAKIELITPAGHDNIDLDGVPMIAGWGWHPSKAGGVTPMATLADMLAEIRSAVSWRRSQWDTAPRFGGLLKHPSSFRDEARRERFRESWREWMQGRKGTPILEDGITYEPPSSLAPKDALDLDGRKLTAVEVASAFHIPPELVGDREGTYSNMQAFRSMLYGVTLGPLIEDLQQAANTGLLPRLDTDPALYVEISREAALNGSLVEQASVLQTMTGGPIMTRTEARDRLNLPHIDEADELIVPLNVLVGGQASPTDSGAQNRRSL